MEGVDTVTYMWDCKRLKGIEAVVVPGGHRLHVRVFGAPDVPTALLAAAEALDSRPVLVGSNGLFTEWQETDAPDYKEEMAKGVAAAVSIASAVSCSEGTGRRDSCSVWRKDSFWCRDLVYQFIEFIESDMQEALEEENWSNLRIIAQAREYLTENPGQAGHDLWSTNQRYRSGFSRVPLRDRRPVGAPVWMYLADVAHSVQWRGEALV